MCHNKNSWSFDESDSYLPHNFEEVKVKKTGQLRYSQHSKYFQI